MKQFAVIVAISRSQSATSLESATEVREVISADFVDINENGDLVFRNGTELTMAYAKGAWFKVYPLNPMPHDSLS